MSNCNKTIPTIVEGDSLYEAVCLIKQVADKAIADAGTTATAAEEAKAAAATAQQTAEAAHEEAQTAAANAEQAGERAQAAANAAAKAQADAIMAQTTADTATTAAEAAHEEAEIARDAVTGITDGTTELPYLRKQGVDGYVSVPVVLADGATQEARRATANSTEWLNTTRTIALRVAGGNIEVPDPPYDNACAANKQYVDRSITAAIAGAGMAVKTNLTGATIQADESGMAVSQLSAQCVNISGFGGTLGKINYLDLKGEIGTNYSENPSKKLSFDLTTLLGSGGNPGVMGYIPVNVYSGTNTHFTMAKFDSNTGKMVIDCSTFDPSGGNVWQVFSQHIYYAN